MSDTSTKTEHKTKHHHSVDPSANGRANERPPKPTALKVRFKNIPRQLRELDQWLLWKYELVQNKKGKYKYTKVPYSVTGGKASSTDPETFSTFDKVKAAYKRGGWDGVGIVHLPENNITGIDEDHTKSMRLVREIDSYAEWSPSSNGKRIFAYGRKPDRKRSKRGNLEMYDGQTADGTPGGRFLTVTGHRIGKRTTIHHRQEAITRIYKREILKEPSKNGKPSRKARSDKKPRPPDKDRKPKFTDEEADELIEKEKKNDTKLRLVDEGRWDDPRAKTEDGSASGADLYLCLAFARMFKGSWGDIDRQYRRSEMFKVQEGKWDSKRGSVTYGEKTINEAIARCEEADEEKDDRPEIRVSTDEYRTTRQAVKLLGSIPGIYQRGENLCRIVRDEGQKEDWIQRPTAPRPVPLPAPLLQELLTQQAKFVSKNKKGKSTVHPPGWCIAQIMARTYWEGVRKLNGVINSPTLRPDGTVLSKPGYDEATGLRLEWNGKLDIPEKPTREDAVKACKKLREVVCDFPFKSPEHESAWIAGY
jgi:hypothetical protein